MGNDKRRSTRSVKQEASSCGRGILHEGCYQEMSLPAVKVVQIFSPLLVHTDATNFRSLVQKLTGKNSTAFLDQKRSEAAAASLLKCVEANGTREQEEQAHAQIPEARGKTPDLTLLSEYGLCEYSVERDPISTPLHCDAQVLISIESHLASADEYNFLRTSHENQYIY